MASSPSLSVGVRLAPEARTRAALIALGWKPPDDDPGAGTDMWTVAVHVPIGREAEIPELLDTLGFEVYRMWRTEPPDKPERLTGTSRKLGRSWARIVPGIQGRLISFGGLNDAAYAWIDVREKSDG